VSQVCPLPQLFPNTEFRYFTNVVFPSQVCFSEIRFSRILLLQILSSHKYRSRLSPQDGLNEDIVRRIFSYFGEVERVVIRRLEKKHSDISLRRDGVMLQVRDWEKCVFRSILLGKFHTIRIQIQIRKGKMCYLSMCRIYVLPIYHDIVVI
jgi:hypothetical protein